MDYDGIDDLLNTTANMEILVNNSKKDDNTITVSGVDWFKYNGVTAATLYASGNHWIGIGASTEDLKVCRRDGAMYYLYRQEGTVWGSIKFLKIRWEGYTYYSSTSASYVLKYEFFLFDTGDMFLNVIQTPTNSGYIGTSSLTCGAENIALDIPINSSPMICFDHQDETGSSWAVRYEKMVIEPPWERRYLIRDGRDYYTVLDGLLSLLDITELTAQVFRENGLDTPPDISLMNGFASPVLLFWQDGGVKPELTAAITAIPYNQTIYTDNYDMTHPSIIGIERIAVETDEHTLFAISFDNGVTWRAHNGAVWNVLSEEQSGMTKAALEGISVDAWAEVTTTGQYKLRFTLLENSAVQSITVHYLNREETGI